MLAASKGFVRFALRQQVPIVPVATIGGHDTVFVLSEGRFLDGTTVADLPRPVEVIATDGGALRAALEIR